MFEKNNALHRLNILFASQRFLLLGVSLVVLLSIYLRSIIDIGADTAIYLNLGQKLWAGEKYYYDFFESNFPISFYIYALEYFIAQKLGINVIFMSEIVVNIAGVLSIFFSARLLFRSNIYEDKIIYNVLILSFAMGYFLRPLALEIGEFGTKTTFLLLLLMPYMAYCLLDDLSKKDLVIKGIIMGVIPCIKPHYLIFIVVLEGYFCYFFKKKYKIIGCDKLIMAVVGGAYLWWMFEAHIEFFEFIVPMWPKIYSAYDDWGVFMSNIVILFSSNIAVVALVLLIFSRIRADRNDVIFLLFFIASSLLLIVENINSVDQVAIFYFVSTILIARCFVRFIRSKKCHIYENKFVIGLLFLIPFFDLDILPNAFFALDGIINCWWLVVLFYVYYKVRNEEKYLRLKAYKFICGIVLLFILAIYLLVNVGPWAYLSCNFATILLVIYFLEKKLFSDIQDDYSSLIVFFIFLVFSFLFFSYLRSIWVVTKTSQDKIKDAYSYYAKQYGVGDNDKIVMLAKWNSQNYPISNYLKKDNILKFHLLKIDPSHSQNGSEFMFNHKDQIRNFTYNYLFDDVKTAFSDDNVKVIMLDIGREMVEKDHLCIIHPLEFYLQDLEVRKEFFDNFRFENRVVITNKSKVYNGFMDKALEVNNIKYDYEIYVRETEK